MNAQRIAEHRQMAIRELLSREGAEYHTQHDLASALALEGYVVTQPALCRDLQIVGAVKVPGPNGKRVYRLIEATQEV